MPEHPVSTFAAAAVSIGLALSVISFIAQWRTDSPVPSLLFPAGLFAMAFGFWLIDKRG